MASCRSSLIGTESESGVTGLFVVVDQRNLNRIPAGNLMEFSEVGIWLWKVGSYTENEAKNKRSNGACVDPPLDALASRTQLKPEFVQVALACSLCGVGIDDRKRDLTCSAAKHCLARVQPTLSVSDVNFDLLIESW